MSFVGLTALAALFMVISLYPRPKSWAERAGEHLRDFIDERIKRESRVEDLVEATREMIDAVDIGAETFFRARNRVVEILRSFPRKDVKSRARS